MTLFKYLCDSSGQKINFIDLGGVACRKPPKFLPIEEDNENNIKGYFNDFSYFYAFTITIKGNNTKEYIKKLTPEKQYLKILDTIDNYLLPYCDDIIIFPEFHRCGEYIHVHGALNLKPKTAKNRLENIKKQIYDDLKKPAFRNRIYKHFLQLEKCIVPDKWLKYIMKESKYARKMNMYPMVNNETKQRIDKIKDGYYKSNMVLL